LKELPVKLSKTLVSLTLASLMGTSFAEEDRSAVLEQIRPIGRVTITGQVAPAKAAEKKPAETKSAAEAKPAEAPAAEAKAAEAPAEPQTAAFDAAKTYNTLCVACHATGAAGAPKLDDKANWAPRIEKGMEALYTSALNGTTKGMPPRGTCVQCSDDELKSVVDYMVSQAK
jgi:cytochrome c5